MFQKVHGTLRSGGIFRFNIELPVFTAGVDRNWIYAEEGAPKCWPMDQYFFPGERNTRFLGCDVIKQHHTLTQILMGLLVDNSFALKAVEEAVPSEEMLDIPDMKDELSRPMMLLVKAEAVKTEGQAQK